MLKYLNIKNWLSFGFIWYNVWVCIILIKYNFNIKRDLYSVVHNQKKGIHEPPSNINKMELTTHIFFTKCLVVIIIVLFEVYVYMQL